MIGGYVNGGHQANGNSGSSSGTASPNRELWGGASASGGGKADGQYQPSLPPVAAEVLRTAYERHRRGLMSPYIYQLLTQVAFSLLISFLFGGWGVAGDQSFRKHRSIAAFDGLRPSSEGIVINARPGCD